MLPTSCPPFPDFAWRKVPLLCSFSDPWWVYVQASAEIESRFIDWLLAGPCPKIKMVSRSATFETTEHVAAEVSRKGAVFSSLGWFMERTFPSHLVARALDHHKAEQLQNLRHGYVSSKLSVIDASHDHQPKKNREEEPVSSYSGVN
jgi:hypothetical protein